MIKKVVKLILRFFCKSFAIAFSYSSLTKLISFRVKLYTYWIAKEFKSMGDLVLIYYPINLVGGKYILLGNRVLIGKNAVLTAWDRYKRDVFIPVITIDNDTSIGEDCHITAINKITIGKNVLIGKKVTITDNDHGKTDSESLTLPPIDRRLYSKGAVIIEDNVWIGDKATILGNVKIGENAIIGANSLVTKDVPKNCVVGGVPAKIIKIIN